ncbi:hypothetical protein WN944_021901 [Citrus x changshan-huyou]|uniref:Uncharacterized protein n=2 Tax=Citrus TaxID=2706 RepID=V4UKX8_CITCL|nr:uncharacterized protein LOC18036096 [Citrus x clementina]XP_006465808.2 uncharacterized protein LOC102621516 [Citrus sinensis]ESR40034.1 hypothetical protein CICLE_v10026732mg [Citrus x clementina]KAH9665446.1 hypothetical protein KPL70_020349 [Citrus sinensis]
MRSMATACSSAPYISIQKSAFGAKTVLKQTQLVSFKKAATIKLRSSFKTKAFEDHFEGIICYRDENGEMICEGYDEGPRFHQQIPRATFHPRDVEIMNILLQRWHEIVNDSGGECNNAGKGGVAVQEDINWNGFNTFF